METEYVYAKAGQYPAVVRGSDISPKARCPSAMDTLICQTEADESSIAGPNWTAEWDGGNATCLFGHLCQTYRAKSGLNLSRRFVIDCTKRRFRRFSTVHESQELIEF